MTERLERLLGRPRRALIRTVSSARARILASYVLLLFFATIVSVIAVRELLFVGVEDRVKRNLIQETDEFRRLVDGSDPRTGKPFGSDLEAIFDVFLSRNVPSEDEQIVTFLDSEPYRTVSTGGNDYLLEDHPELASRWGSLTEPEQGQVATSGGPASYAVLPVELGGEVKGRFVAASLVAGEREEVDEAVQTVGGVAFGVLLIGTVIGFFAAGRVLAPLGRLTDTARQITESDLTRRIEVRGSDEIAEQARTFNAMLDRLEAAFESQRSLIRDVGHELRTPVTIVRGNLELLDEDDDPAERRETLALVSGELDRMTRLIEDLVVLARSERPDFLELQTIDLAEFSDELFAKATQLGERDWALEQRGAGVVVADRQRLTQATMNLAQNAVEQTERGDRIALGAVLRGGLTRLWVGDRGPGISPADRDMIFERFARGRSGRDYEGTGLGLAIVRAIAEAHGGTVEIESPPGGGARFTITLPADPDRAEAL